MPDIALDQGAHFPSPLTEWYRERPFKVALVGSLLAHAALLAAVPGFRSVTIEVPKVLNVEILKQEQPQPVTPSPVKRQPAPRPEEVVQPPQPVVEQPVMQPVPKRVDPQPEPRVRQPDPVVRPPEPVVRQPPPEVPPVPRAEIIEALPRLEQRPDPVVVPKPEPRPAPSVEPRPEPRAEIRPDSPVPRVAPPQQVPAVQPRVEPVAPPQRDVPASVVPQVAVQPPPPVAVPAAPVPAARTEAVPERGLVNGYEKSLADLIKRHEKYPDRAKRQGWQGTAVVGLSLSADGKVTDISIIESSGREILDEAALNMVRRASPLPRAPEGLRGKERTVRVPIVFKLQDS